MSVSSIAIIIGLIIGVCGLVACIIVACTHRSLNPMKISLIVMSAGGFIGSSAKLWQRQRFLAS